MDDKKSWLKKIIGILGATVALAAITVSIITIDNNGSITIFNINYGKEYVQSTPFVTANPIVTDIPSTPVPVATEVPNNPAGGMLDTETFIKSYLEAMTMAINNLDFSIESKFLDEGSQAYYDRKEHIEKTIQGTGLQEELVSITILEENRVNDTIIVHTKETYNLASNKRGFRTIPLETQYTIKNINGTWKITYINNITEE